MFEEMLPNILPYLASSFAGGVSGAILAATGLEALGLGPTRVPTLGMTIYYAMRACRHHARHVVVVGHAHLGARGDFCGLVSNFDRAR